MAAVMDAAQTCNAPVDGLQVIYAANLEDIDERSLVAVKAAGIGDEDLMRCMGREVGKAIGQAPGVMVFETRGDIRLIPYASGGRLIILNKDTLVIVDTAWEQEVLTAIDHDFARITDSPVAESMARVDRSSDVWFSMAVSEPYRAKLGDTPGADGLESLNATLDLGVGVELELDLGFTSPGHASAFRTDLAKTMDLLGPDVEQLGVPRALIDSVRITGEGARLTVNAGVGSEELPRLLTGLGSLMAEP